MRLPFLTSRREKAERVAKAIKAGFVAAGLPHQQAENDAFDILVTGKFHEVAYYAGKELGISLRSVGDLRKVFDALA